MSIPMRTVSSRESCGERHDGEKSHPCKLDVGHVGDHSCFWSSCGKTWPRSASDTCAPEKVGLEDDATSHLNNALQVSTLLAAELPKMIGNPGYLDDATKGLTAIDERIRAALELIEHWV